MDYMAYTNGKSDNKNCVNHRWPRSLDGVLKRGTGSVQYQCCRDCLTIKVIWASRENIDGKWCLLLDERIVEPNLAP